MSDTDFRGPFDFRASPDFKTGRARLAVLLREAEEQGGPLGTLSAIVEEASAEGARRALAACNLADAQAGEDIRDLRNLLEAWRDTKDTIRQTFVKWILRAALTAILIGLAVRLDWLTIGPGR